MGLDKELGIVHAQYHNHEFPNARAVVAIERLLERKDRLLPENVKAMAKVMSNAMRLGMRSPREVTLGREVRTIAHVVAGVVPGELRAHLFGDTGDIMRFAYHALAEMPDAAVAKQDYLRAYHGVAHFDPAYALTIACNMSDLGRGILALTGDSTVEREALVLIDRAFPRVRGEGIRNRAQGILYVLRARYGTDTTNF